MLLCVPNEILAHIFSIIECEDVEGGWDTKSSYSALLSLSRVCKRFRVIAEFYLYRNIFLLEDDADEKWLQFARGLQRDPKRGLTTRKFCSQRYDPMAPPNFLRFLTKYFLKFSLSPDRDRIPPGLRSVIQHELESRIYKRPYRSLRVLLLLLMPDLRHLELTITDLKSTPFLLNGTFESDEDYGCYGFETNEESPSYKGIPNIFFFRHLESVTLRSYDDNLGSPIRGRTFSGILNHPCVKALRLDGFAVWHCTCMRLNWGKAPSNLTRLDLDNCILQPMSLKRILEKCRSLTHLNMALTGFGDVKDPTHNFEDFGIVLREHGRNLVELSITKPMWDPHIADPFNFIGPLKELTVLKHLSIGRLNFVGPIDDDTKKDITIHDALPQSLETLTIEAEVAGYLIAATGEATATPYFIYRLRDAMLADPTGRRILRARPRISSKTLSLEALRALPENSVGRAYVGWLDREGVSPDTRATVRYIDDEECAYVMQRYRECHDFYHALTGLPIVREGEVALKAFEFANTLLPMTGLSIFAAATMKRSERQRFASIYLPWALKNGARSKEVINVFWEERLEDDVSDLRKELGIEQPPDMRDIRKREREEKKRLKELREQGL
ncbi:hypothetical protein ACKLNR_012628 [Fusarium oxysporum f. sp. zingiberi]